MARAFRLDPAIRSAAILNVLVWGFVLLLSGYFWGLFLVDFVPRAVLGPKEVGPQDLDGLSWGSGRLVTVQIADVVPVGRRKVSKYSSLYYYGTTVGDRLLLVQSEEGSLEPGTVTGAARALPRELRGEASGNPRVVQGLLEIPASRFGGWYHLFWGILVLGFGLTVWISFGQALKTSRHPAYELLTQGGQHAHHAVEALEREIEQHGIQVGPLWVTPNWVVRSSAMAVDLFRLDQLVWAYKKVTEHKKFGLITVSRDIEVVIHLRDGQTCEFKANEDTCNQALQLMAERMPWMVFGHTDELDKLWKTDRAAFVAAVDVRRGAGRGPG